MPTQPIHTRTAANASAPRLPSLSDLGADLLRVSPRRRAFVLARPPALAALYAALATRGWWIPALAVLAAVCPAMGAVVHVLLHRSLGLSRQTNQRWLTVMGVLVLQSGHAIQATHLEHHRRFPASDDPEAYVAAMPLKRALLEGPIYPYRLWTWARHARPEHRRRINIEAASHAALGLASVVLLPITRVPFVYASAMFIACSLFPAVSVNLLHHIEGDTPLTLTRTVRGALLPALTLGSGYHLEHHLYPRVPSPNYRRLAKRLQPALDAHGVNGYQLPHPT